MQVWQAILSKKVDLDSWKIKQSMSEPARNLLRVWDPSTANCLYVCTHDILHHLL